MPVDTSEYVMRGGLWVGQVPLHASGFVSVATGPLVSSGANYGASPVFTIPHVARQGNQIILIPSVVGTGYGQFTQNGYGTVEGSVTKIPVRFIQLANNSQQTISASWISLPISA